MTSACSKSRRCIGFSLSHFSQLAIQHIVGSPSYMIAPNCVTKCGQRLQMSNSLCITFHHRFFLLVCRIPVPASHRKLHEIRALLWRLHSLPLKIRIETVVKAPHQRNPILVFRTGSLVFFPVVILHFMHDMKIRAFLTNLNDSFCHVSSYCSKPRTVPYTKCNRSAH